jgi:hypothetical protein
MKYLKYFQEASEYTEYKSSSDYVTPNVSYVVEGNFVDYKAYVIEKLIMQVGNKYPEIEERFKSMVNKYFPSASSNAINDMLNMPEVPEYIKDWKYSCEISNSEVSIEPVYDQSNESYSTDNYVLTFDIDVMFYDPSIDIDNINWEDPSIEEKIIRVGDIEVSQLLSSEDNDFIKSISVDGELEYTSHIYLYVNVYDENGNYVGNQGVFNELESIRLYWDRWYNLSSWNDYELVMEPQPV